MEERCGASVARSPNFFSRHNSVLYMKSLDFYILVQITLKHGAGQSYTYGAETGP